MGAIWRMSLQTHYERDDAHSGKLVAAVWREIWEDLQVSNCCNGGAQQNINIYMKMIQTQIYIQTLTQLWIAAAFDVQVAFLGTPADFDTDPGDAGPEIASRNRALCMITQSFVDEMFNTGMSWIEDSTIGITAIGVGALAVPVIPVWIIGAGFSAVALALSSLYGELQRSDYRSYMACALFEALKGVSTNNRAAFADAWDNLPARPPPSETPSEDIARDAIEAWGRAQLSLEGNYVAFVSQLKAAMEIAENLTDNDCPCLGEWEQTFLNGHGNDDIEALVLDGGSLTAIYNAVDDRYESPCLVGQQILRVLLKIPFSASTITRVRLSVSYISTRATVNDGLSIGVQTGPPHLASAPVSGTDPAALVDTGAISTVEDDLFFDAVVAVSTSTCPETSGGFAAITQIIINGTGTNPFI